MTEDKSTAARPQSLRSKMRAGVVFWGMGTFASRAFRFVAMYALVWLLTPADFGLFVMTTAFMNVLQMISDFGVGVAVIQRKEVNDAYVSTAFWVNLAASLLLMAFAWVTAPWVARFYGAPEISKLVRVTSLSFPVLGLRTIPMALLRRRMQFGLSSAVDAIWSATSAVLMLVFAWFGAGYWSLVVPTIIMGAVTTPLWFAFAKWMPSLRFDGRDLVELFHFAKHLVGASVLALVWGNAGFVIAGHLLGKDAAGLFNIATSYSVVILLNYAYLIGNVSLSAFSARQDDSGLLQRAFMRIYEALAASTLPFHALGIALAPLIFASVMPKTYSAALLSFQILLACAAVRSITAHVAPFYNAINKAHVNLYFNLIGTPISILVMYVACERAHVTRGAQAGLDALAWANGVTQIAAIVLLLATMRKGLGWRRAGLLRNLLPYAVASAVAIIAAKGVEYGATFFAAPNLIVLTAATAAGLAVYVLFIYFFARNRLRALLEDALPRTFRERYVLAYFPSLRPLSADAQVRT